MRPLEEERSRADPSQRGTMIRARNSVWAVRNEGFSKKLRYAGSGASESTSRTNGKTSSGNVRGSPPASMSSESGEKSLVNQGIQENFLMEGEVWTKHLPEEVMNTILAWLPLDSFARLRCVCKKWNALLDDLGFQEIRSRVAGHALLYIVDPFDGEGPKAHNVASGVWKPFPLSSIMQDSAAETVDVTASAGGLLLVTLTPPWEQTESRRFQYRPRASLCTINPLTKSMKALPFMIGSVDYGRGPHIVELMMDKDKKGYMILAATTNIGHCRNWVWWQGKERIELQLYNSEKPCWQSAGVLVRDKREKYGKVVGAALHNGSLYCMTLSLTEEVVRYNVYVDDEAGQEWRDGPSDLPDCKFPSSVQLDEPHLFENRGRLCLVAGLNQSGRSTRKVLVWELDFKKSEWVEVQSIPDELLCVLLGDWKIYNIHIVVCGDYICVEIHDGKATKPQPHKVAMCNLVNSSWSILPMCPRRDVISECVFNLGFGCLYEPRLDVKV